MAVGTRSNATLSNVCGDYMVERIGIYAGSFDPFHKGHKNIVEQALNIVDNISIIIAHNNNKKLREWRWEESEATIEEYIVGNKRISVTSLAYNKSPAQIAQEKGNAFLIRGIRDVTDMDYERRLSAFNMELFGIQTIFIFAKPELAHVNGTAIRELKNLGLDYGRYL